MEKLMWVILAFLSGAVLPIQGGLNTKLSKAAESPVHASMLTFVIGLIGLLLYIVVTRQSVSWVGVKDAPWHAWIGGLLGAFYVTVIILAFPKLGPGLTFGLIVAGQMIVSVVLEHYNILVEKQNPINFMNILGVILIVTGVVIVWKY